MNASLSSASPSGPTFALRLALDNKDLQPYLARDDLRALTSTCKTLAPYLPEQTLEDEAMLLARQLSNRPKQWEVIAQNLLSNLADDAAVYEVPGRSSEVLRQCRDIVWATDAWRTGTRHHNAHLPGQHYGTRLCLAHMYAAKFERPVWHSEDLYDSAMRARYDDFVNCVVRDVGFTAMNAGCLVGLCQLTHSAASGCASIASAAHHAGHYGKEMVFDALGLGVYAAGGTAIFAMAKNFFKAEQDTRPERERAWANWQTRQFMYSDSITQRHGKYSDQEKWLRWKR